MRSTHLPGLRHAGGGSSHGQRPKGAPDTESRGRRDRGGWEASTAARRSRLVTGGGGLRKQTSGGVGWRGWSGLPGVERS